jgi:6-pyruvoyltetrahydropterin/6-carboxytetrahydropterin synthase
MFRLTREVRFAVNDPCGAGAGGPGGVDAQLGGKPANGHGGFPSVTGFGYALAARVTLAGTPAERSQYLENIKAVDEVVRGRLADVSRMITRDGARPVEVVAFLRDACAAHWGERFEGVALLLGPFVELKAVEAERPMVRLSQRFEFSASHRLFNRALSDEENRRIFGKCSNPHGHGHNYELQVTVAGEPGAVGGVLIGMPAFERIVAEAVIERFDHKNLNVEVPEFRELIPSVENIARVIYKLLKPRFGGDGPDAAGGGGAAASGAGVRLAAVTVWETPKTWCEYAE